VARGFTPIKITPQANLFVLKTQPVESNGGAAAPFAAPAVEPLKSIRPNGSDGSTSPLQARLGVQQISNPDWAAIAATLHQSQVQSGSLPGQPPALTPSWAQGLPILGFAPGLQVGTSHVAGSLTSVYSRNGQAVVREIMTLSADHKRMTVTTSKRAPSGELVDNVKVYDRE